MRTVAVWAWGLALGALAGCGHTDRANEERARDGQARWEEQGLTSYVYVVRHGCVFGCSFGSVRVVVENGAVVSAINTETGLWVERAQTMTELLDDVVAIASRSYSEYSATYNDELGYLEHLDARNNNVPDSGFSIDVSCFSESTTDDACPLPTIASEDCPGETAPGREPTGEGAIESCIGAEPIGRITGEDRVCCPSHAGRSCEELITLLTSELEGQRGCSEDADCHWESILPPTPDCYAPLGNVTSLDVIHEIEDAVMQQDCLITKTEELCGPVVIGPAVCREGRCEL